MIAKQPTIYMSNNNRSETVFDLVGTHAVHIHNHNTGEQWLYVVTDEELDEWIDNNKLDGFEIAYF